MAARPRLLVSSLAVALVVGVGGGWLLGRALTDDGIPDDVVLDTPGEYQQPSDGDAVDATGAALPAVTLLDADGRTVESASLLGGPLVVNVWFSTCPPCERELADFAAVEQETGDTVRFVGVNPIDPADTMVRFAADRGVGYELLRDPEGEFVDAIGLVNYPTTLFVDADGAILAETGVLDAATLRARIDEVFRGVT